MGWAMASTQWTDGLSFPFSYTYNVGGGVETETYPSGRAVTTCYDSLGRASGVSGLWSSATTSYTPTAGSGPGVQAGPGVQYGATSNGTVTIQNKQVTAKCKESGGCQ